MAIVLLVIGCYKFYTQSSFEHVNPTIGLTESVSVAYQK